jgi:hypothetical protein
VVYYYLPWPFSLACGLSGLKCPLPSDLGVARARGKFGAAGFARGRSRQVPCQPLACGAAIRCKGRVIHEKEGGLKRGKILIYKSLRAPIRGKYPITH